MVAFYFSVELQKLRSENSGRTSGKLRPDLERTPAGVWQKAGGSFITIQE